MDNYDNMIMINMVSKFDVCFPYHRCYLSVQKHNLMIKCTADYTNL